MIVSKNNCNDSFKKSANGKISFWLNKKSVTAGRHKEFVKYMFPGERKAASNGRDIWEIGTKWFLLVRKSVCTSQNEGFIKR